MASLNQHASLVSSQVPFQICKAAQTTPAGTGGSYGWPTPHYLKDIYMSFHSFRFQAFVNNYVFCYVYLGFTLILAY